MLLDSVNMALAPRRRLLCYALLLCAAAPPISGRSKKISDLKSKISGVEELLEEFRKQLQQDQAYTRADDVIDSCLGGFSSAEGRIIRARASIERGATFLSAPDRVYNWKDCVHACCSEQHCTVAVVQEDLGGAEHSLSCYLFNCTYRNNHVCSFAPQQGFGTYSRTSNTTDVARNHDNHNNDNQEVDEPPRSDAGQDVVIQLPTDWAVLDGRDSVDDHGIGRYEWTLVGGEPSINMKVTRPGLLKVSGLHPGDYVFQMTVTDTAGQKSSDNVSVTVLAPERHAEVCTGRCSHYQFLCDDGCCIDIDYACDGTQHCPDRSDEDFCPNFDSSRKAVTHPAGGIGQDRPAPQVDSDSAHQTGSVGKTAETPLPSDPQDRTRVAPPPPSHQGPSGQGGPIIQGPCAAPAMVGPCKGTFPRWYYDREAGECKHFLYGGCQGNHNNFLQESDCVNECIQKSPDVKPATAPTPTPTTTTTTTKQSTTAPTSRGDLEGHPVSKPVLGGHPIPESGAILPLALGLVITALLLLIIGCRLRLVRHKLKKTRPLTTEESDYLINGMYL